ncbi:MAG TPA: ABC transporter ATP-binding protein [Candidatus Eisenbacteria bacterium]
MLHAVAVRRLAEFRLEAEIEVDRGSTLVLVGESGAGKTLLLRMLAGLEHPDAGRIELGDQVYFDGRAGEMVPAWRRSIGYVGQDYALFPHLSAFENVAFGLRAQGLRGRRVRLRVGEMLERFGIGDLARRRPRELSGGQQQRVAVARALVIEPALLLLDEPLSALDLQTRRTLQSELRRMLAERAGASVYVTHSPVEAALFGDRIAVLEGGLITQKGSRDELLRYPKSPYVAEFLGVNLYRGTLGYRDFAGLVEVQTPDITLSVVDPGGEDETFVLVNPREVTLFLERPEGSAQNTFYGPIGDLVPEPPFGDRVRVVVESKPPIVAEVTKHAIEALGLKPGVPVYASFKASGVSTYR